MSAAIDASSASVLGRWIQKGAAPRASVGDRIRLTTGETGVVRTCQRMRGGDGVWRWEGFVEFDDYQGSRWIDLVADVDSWLVDRTAAG